MWERHLLCMAEAGLDPRDREHSFWAELNQYVADKMPYSPVSHCEVCVLFGVRLSPFRRFGSFVSYAPQSSSIGLAATSLPMPTAPPQNRFRLDLHLETADRARVALSVAAQLSHTSLRPNARSTKRKRSDHGKRPRLVRTTPRVK